MNTFRIILGLMVAMLISEDAWSRGRGGGGGRIGGGGRVSAGQRARIANGGRGTVIYADQYSNDWDMSNADRLKIKRAREDRQGISRQPTIETSADRLAAQKQKELEYEKQAASTSNLASLPRGYGSIYQSSYREPSPAPADRAKAIQVPEGTVKVSGEGPPGGKYVGITGPRGGDKVVATLPSEATVVRVLGSPYYVYNDVYYYPFNYSGKTYYEEVPEPVSEPATPDSSEPAQGTREQGTSPDPRELLKQMGNHVANLQQFCFQANEIRERVAPGQEVIQYAHERIVCAVRPDKVATEVSGDQADRKFIYSGQQATMLDRTKNTYGVMDVSGDIDTMLDMILQTYNISLPLTDFLYQDMYDRITPGIVNTRYIGLNEIDGDPCHHLAFSQNDIDWELWVQAEGDPLPRKFGILYKQVPGHPRYVAKLSRWTVTGEIPDSTFKFAPSEEMKKIDLKSSPSADR